MCKNNNCSLQGLEDAINQALGGMAVVDLNSMSAAELRFFNSLSNEEKCLLFGPPQDWSKLTNSQRIKTVVDFLRLLNINKKCGYSFGNTNLIMNNIFTNLPIMSTSPDFQGSILYNGVEIELGFAIQATSNCLNCISNEICERESQGIIYYEYMKCGLNCGTAVPCLTIRVNSNDDNLFFNYLKGLSFPCQ